MANKNFVSIAFFPGRLQVLQLNSKKSKLKKLTSVNLPRGLIVDHRVRDSKTLADIIKGVWKSAGIREKSVGIVVPEFSTFTKSLKLPKLEVEEMDEAVRWQSHDFLPFSSTDIVMDWKIVAEEGGNFNILATAIQKTLLAGYVDAVSLAGFYPLVVETPSLSLARISDGQVGGRLVIFKGFGETILVVTDAETIIGSSVIPSVEFTDILKTAGNIVNHYKTTKIDRVLIGGLGFGQGQIASLQKKLGKQIAWITPKIEGLTPAQLQEYLVPISMQLKDPAEPMDETTINLLPPTWAKQYEDKRTKARIMGLMIIATIVVSGSLLASVAARVYLSRQIYLDRHAGTQEEPLLVEEEELASKVAEINGLVDSVDRIELASVNPQKLLNILHKDKPSGIRLNQYLIDYDTGSLLLRGIAADRQTLIDFKGKLEDNKDFSLVYIPISSLEAEKDLEFEVRFVYLPSKKKDPVKLKI